VLNLAAVESDDVANTHYDFVLCVERSDNLFACVLVGVEFHTKVKRTKVWPLILNLSLA